MRHHKAKSWHLIKLTERVWARGSKCHEREFQFQSKPTWRMLEIFPGVSKKPELRPTCLWVMPKSPTQRDLSSLVINTPKLESVNTRLLTLANFSTHEISLFYFLTQTFHTSEPGLEISSDQQVWQFEKLKHLPLNHFGRWQPSINVHVFLGFSFALFVCLFFRWDLRSHFFVIPSSLLQLC